MKDILKQIPEADAIRQSAETIAAANAHGKAAIAAVLTKAREDVAAIAEALRVEGVEPIEALLKAEQFDRDVDVWLRGVVPVDGEPPLPPAFAPKV